MRRLLLCSVLCVALGRLQCTQHRDGDAANVSMPDPLLGVVNDKTGRVVRSIQDYAFEQSAGAAPSVNPSLWRQAQLNNFAGLLKVKVADRVYQVRGMDLSNLDIIEAAKKATLPDEVQAGRIQIAGDRGKVTALLGMLDEFEPRFDIVTP